MSMDYDSLCKKMGYNPLTDKYPFPISDHEDDSIVSPFSVLTIEESEFMYEYLMENRDKIITD